jgi:hypothetical protein
VKVSALGDVTAFDLSPQGIPSLLWVQTPPHPLPASIHFPSQPPPTGFYHFSNHSLRSRPRPVSTTDLKSLRHPSYSTMASYQPIIDGIKSRLVAAGHAAVLAALLPQIFSQRDGNSSSSPSVRVLSSPRGPCTSMSTRSA